MCSTGPVATTSETVATIPETVAEAYLLALKARGVDFLFGNAGTDFAPIIEALARAEADGLDVPEAVEIIHETLTTGMAYGYYLATGKPQAAMVHVNVGLANAVMGIINASKGRVPMLFTSGRTPLTEHGRVGSRNAPIHWGQEMFDQGGMVREFVKWDHELVAGEQVVDLVDRALSIAQAEPKGPTYLSLPREVLAERWPTDVAADLVSGVTIPSAPHPDPVAIAEAVAMLAEAEHPLIVASGGDEAIFAAVSALAEEFAVPVCQFWRTSPVISTTHPFFAGESPKAELARADLVISLDTLVPWMPASMPLRDGARVIQLGPDPLFNDTPARSFPADLMITSSVAPALTAIHAGLKLVADPDLVDGRRQALVPELAVRRTRERAAGAFAGDGAAMSPEFMSRVIGETVGPDAIVVNELGLAPATMDFTQHDSYFGPAISAGLGWGVPAALGIALANKRAGNKRQVVACTGDGSYVFANPAACHHTAAALGLGLLMVVADNRVWNAVRRATIAVYPEGRAATAAKMPLSSLEPAPDYPKLVEAYGGHGEHVDDPTELAAALRRALAVTATGRQALVSVHCSYSDQANR
jgi:acetolactate synthase-1/2/3 large subunit